jgi:tetratricopeptide (TPR) repeat protein
MLVVASLVLAQAVTSGWSSRRPSECSDEGARRANVWERAKVPELRRYCDLVASASSKLAGTAAMATAALEAAREADRALPGRGAPRALEGRALAALGQLPEALAALEDGRARDPRALDDPLALHALARVLAGTGRSAEAAVAYRALLPRAAGLASSERTLVAVEAGLVAMDLGPGGLEEAVADLREALRAAQQGDGEGFVVLALALALDRSARADEARALLGERSRGDPRNIVAAWLAKQTPRLPASEAAALEALALERSDPAGARDAWEEHLRLAPRGPWASHAQGRVVALGGGRARSGSVR